MEKLNDDILQLTAAIAALSKIAHAPHDWISEHAKKVAGAALKYETLGRLAILGEICLDEAIQHQTVYGEDRRRKALFGAVAASLGYKIPEDIMELVKEHYMEVIQPSL